nr:Uncharacterised protein [Salmonella sp. NCTC 7297]
MTTTPMVSLHLRGQRLRIRIWPISQQRDGLHDGVTGVGTDQRAVIQWRGKRSLQTRQAWRATSRMVIHIHCPV